MGAPNRKTLRDLQEGLKERSRLYTGALCGFLNKRSKCPSSKELGSKCSYVNGYAAMRTQTPSVWVLGSSGHKAALSFRAKVVKLGFSTYTLYTPEAKAL